MGDAKTIVRQTCDVSCTTLWRGPGDSQETQSIAGATRAREPVLGKFACRRRVAWDRWSMAVWSVVSRPKTNRDSTTRRRSSVV